MDFLNIQFSSVEVLAADGSVLSHNAPTNATTGQQVDGGGQPPLEFAGMGLVWVAIYTVLIAFMWATIFRPQKKRAQKLQELRNNIKIGDSVVTAGGLYGKVVDIGTDVYVLEFGTNRGVRIPVNKSEIADVKEPDLTPPKEKEA